MKSERVNEKTTVSVVCAELEDRRAQVWVLDVYSDLLCEVKTREGLMHVRSH